MREQRENSPKCIYRWDLDKTYLRTEFDSAKDLLRAALEPAAKKLTIPGATSLLKEIQKQEHHGIHIVSGSPEQLRKVLEKKLRNDGIKYTSLTLKPQLTQLLQGRFHFLKDQVGYKLGALMNSRLGFEQPYNELMFGDDAEADALIYSLYVDICAGIIDSNTLRDVLLLAKVHEERIASLLELQKAIPPQNIGRRIFIHLDRVSSPESFSPLGNRVCPFYNYFQPALILLDMAQLPVSSVLHVAEDLLLKHGFQLDFLTASYQDLVNRSLIGGHAAKEICRTEGSAIASEHKTLLDHLKAGCASHVTLPDLVIEQPSIQYRTLYLQDRLRSKEAKKRNMGKHW